MTKFVEVKFRPEDRRAYTYSAPDEMEIAIGDRVEVDARGTLKVVEGVAISDRKPPYACKPVLRVVPPEPAEEPVPDDPISDVGAGDG